MIKSYNQIAFLNINYKLINYRFLVIRMLMNQLNQLYTGKTEYKYKPKIEVVFLASLPYSKENLNPIGFHYYIIINLQIPHKV